MKSNIILGIVAAALGIITPIKSSYPSLLNKNLSSQYVIDASKQLTSTMLDTTGLVNQLTPSSLSSFAPHPIVIDAADNMADMVSPAIVGVLAHNEYKQSVGAGVCVAEGGIVVTNSHVVHDYPDIALYLADGTRGSAVVLFEDTMLDFAILSTELELPYLEISTIDSCIGDEVIAVGTPIALNLKHTFTKGIVSAINRTIAVNTESGEGYMHNLIQHDASLNRGNSGGPLLNNKGQIVGINTLKLTSSEGIGFAIPAKVIIGLISKAISDQLYNIPYLGIIGYDAEIAHFNKLCDLSNGFYVEHLDPASPISRYLREGDVITKINGKTIDNAIDLRSTIYKLQPNTTIQLTYYRQSNTMQISLSLPSRNA